MLLDLSFIYYIYLTAKVIRREYMHMNTKIMKDQWKELA